MAGLVELLEALPFEAYVVGGAVRDVLLGHSATDIDLATPLAPTKVVELCHREGINAKVSSLDYGLARVVIGDGTALEVTTFRNDVNPDGRHCQVETVSTIQEDLKRRDFTINAMAVDIHGTLIDPYKGQADLESGIIRFVGDPGERIREDKLRIIRAMRFMARFDMELAKKSRLAIAEALSDHLWSKVPTSGEYGHQLSMERIVMEFDKAFKYEAKKFLNFCYSIGLIYYMLPEYGGTPILYQNPKYHGDTSVWDHVVQTAENAPSQYRWEALLHDIGKSLAAQRTSSGWYKFDGHGEIGSRLIKSIVGPRLGFSNKRITSCSIAAEAHMKAHKVKTRADRRVFWSEYGNHMEMLEAVTYADVSGRKTFNSWAFKRPSTALDPVIKGRDLIELGMQPGVETGLVLKETYKFQIKSGIDSYRILLDYAKNIIS